jgi:transglutaminase-like putative cysteine protease
MVTAGLAALAVGLPRALRGNARWVIWTGLLVTVICLASNVTRLVPPEGAVGDARLWDRLVTVVFAAGLTALLFRSGALGVTLVLAGGLPMVMQVLGRSSYEVGAATGEEALLLWVFLALAISFDQAQRLTNPRPSERLPPGAREIFWRMGILAGVLVLAFALRSPVERVALLLQKRLFGLVMSEGPGGRLRRGGNLYLARQPPRNFGGRMRMVLLIQAPVLPGYLRESVYATYADGRWLAAKPGLALLPTGSGGPLGRGSVYALAPASAAVTASVWRVEAVTPQLLSGFCLPGKTVSLTCEGLPPLADANGGVTAGEVFPDRYELAVAPSRLTESAYPLPDGAADPAYVEVSEKIAGAVSNWVEGCEGLATARTVREALSRVERHFQTNFTYRLGVQLRARPDPLVDFMERREGSCTLFASAAALMLRSCGVPTRVVGGYVCCGWNSWLDRWVVREREGHAWVEAWAASEGRWLVADPTPFDGNPHALEQAGAMRMALDLVIAGWKRFVLGLKGDDLLAAIADMGEVAFLFVWHVVRSLPGLAVTGGFALAWWLRRRARRKKLSKAERLRAELAAAMCGIERRAVRARMRRRSSESWDEWLRRVRPELPAQRLEELRAWTESYQVLRYRTSPDEADVRAWIARARRALRNDMRSDLDQAARRTK